jgi:hypothetical protein
MTNDNRELIDVLKAELGFLEKGGYRHTARADWRPQFIFQDSPTCLNFDLAQPEQPCGDCVMSQLVPKDFHDKKIACRHIPLGESGETLDSFYRTGTQEELETGLSAWLKTPIARLERERSRQV